MGAYTYQAKKAKAVDVEVDEETIPDSLLHPRWKVQRTTPITYDDLKENSTDLIRPENMQQTVEYNDSLDRYIIGNKIGDSCVVAPIMMTPEEYRRWTEKRSFADYYRSKNQEILREKGKDKFDFTDMHFSLGPAEKIFGPGGVRIKTQGSAELKFGANIKNIDNPSLPIRNRKTTAMDFDEKINVNVNGKVGDKVNMNLNYNTDATFDSEVLKSDVPVVIDFWAEWCGPCRQMAPVIDEVAAEFGERAKFVKIDVDANPATARSYGVSSIPTFAVVRGGEVVHQFSGSRPKGSFTKEVEKALG